jgi:hypothetical protein
MEFVRPVKQESPARKLIRDLKVLALEYSNAAVFTPKDCEMLTEAIEQNPDLARDDWMIAAKSLIEPMENAFDFKHCGEKLAQMLEAKAIAIQHKRDADAKRRCEIEAVTKAAVEQRRAELESLRKGRRDED